MMIYALSVLVFVASSFSVNCRFSFCCQEQSSWYPLDTCVSFQHLFYFHMFVCAPFLARFDSSSCFWLSILYVFYYSDVPYLLRCDLTVPKTIKNRSGFLQKHRFSVGSANKLFSQSQPQNDATAASLALLLAVLTLHDCCKEAQNYSYCQLLQRM